MNTRAGNCCYAAMTGEVCACAGMNLTMKPIVIALFATALLAPLAWAQPDLGTAPPRVAPPIVLPARVAEAAPVVDARALQIMDEMNARYAALESFSCAMQLRVENAAGEPVGGQDWMRDQAFQATLQWQRPLNIRMEGRNARGAFLALGTDEILRVVSSEHPGIYLSRPRNPPLVLTAEDGTQTTLPADVNNVQFEAPLMEVNAGGPGISFLIDTNFWKRTQQDLRALTLEPDAMADGEPCHVVQMQLAFDDGSTATSRAYIALSDGLLRRTELLFKPRNGGPALDDARIVELYSEVRANPTLPAATWNFEVPANAKPIEYFSQLEPHEYDPDLKIGAPLPTFSSDALDGAPLELNSKSGKVTVVHFFTMSSGAFDTQILNKLARIAGNDQLQIIGVTGDGVRPRVEDFVARLHLKLPIYFDTSAMNNALAQKFGVKGWPTTFIFGRDGRLQFVDDRPSMVDFQNDIRSLLPQISPDDFILQDDEIINTQ